VHLTGGLDHFSWARASDLVVERVTAFVA
jgi:hypothetical protein